MVEKQNQNQSTLQLAEQKLSDLIIEFENLPAEARKFVNFARKSRNKGETNKLNTLEN